MALRAVMSRIIPLKTMPPSSWDSPALMRSHTTAPSRRTIRYSKETVPWFSARARRKCSLTHATSSGCTSPTACPCISRSSWPRV